MSKIKKNNIVDFPLKINEGDAILVPTATFISPVNVILYNKAETD